MLGNHSGGDPAAHVELCLQAHVARLGGAHEIVEDFVGHRLVKGAFVAVRPNVKLERFQLDAQAVRDVVERERGEIRLPGHRAETRELRDLHVDPVIALRRGIGESLEPLAGAGRH